MALWLKTQEKDSSGSNKTQVGIKLHLKNKILLGYLPYATETYQQGGPKNLNDCGFESLFLNLTDTISKWNPTGEDDKLMCCDFWSFYSAQRYFDPWMVL